MANPWFRLYSEFAHDPKIQMLPEAMQRRYVMLMCLRCSETLETLHETEIAFQLRLSEAELIETKQLFVSKNFIDKQWNLLNWDKRQFVSDSSTMRVRKHRDNKKQPSNDDETLQKRSSNAIDTDTDKKQINKKETIVSLVLPDWIPLDTWQAFIEMRKKIKKPPTDYAMKLIVSKLEKFRANGQDVKQVLEKSITSGWQDVFEIKGNPADIVRLTVPSKNEPDAALEKIKADEKRAAPIPDHVRKYIAEVVRKA
jgi:hypothetical protein